MDKFAAAHITDCGPTLRMRAEYSIPPGSGDEPKLDEDGNVIEEVSLLHLTPSSTHDQGCNLSVLLEKARRQTAGCSLPTCFNAQRNGKATISSLRPAVKQWQV